MGLLSTTETVVRGYLRLRGVESRWVDTYVGRVHVFDAPGSGPLPTLVLQHGIGAGNSVQMAGPLLLLRRHFRRVIAPDLVGHGLSPAAPEMTPEVVFAGFAGALDAVLDEPAVIVGNSLGGAMALTYAMMCPERTRGLVLLSPAGATLPDDAWPRFLAGFDMPDRAAALDFLGRLYHRVPWYARWAAHEIGGVFSSGPIRSLLAAIRPDHAFPPEALATIAAPTLLVWGRSDRVMLPEMLAYYRRHLPAAATVEEPEGVGHCPQLDRPFWTARRIHQFAQGLA